MLKKTIYATLILFLLACSGIFAQSELKPRITIFPLSNPLKDVQVEIISRNVQKTMELNLKSIDKYIIAGNDIKEYSSDSAWLLEYCEKNNLDNIIFGQAIIGVETGTVFLEMSVFDRKTSSITLTESEMAETIFDIFDASDLLAVSMMEGFSGMHLGFGGINFKNSGDEGRYSVFIDDAFAGENISTLATILNGERNVKIVQQRMFDELVLFDETVLVLEKKASEVLFSIPGFLEKESKTIAKHENIIEKEWDNKYASRKVDRRFESLFELLAVTDFSKSAAGKKKELEDKLELWNAKKRNWGIEEGVSLLDKKAGASVFAGASLIFPSYSRENTTDWNSSLTLNPKIGASLSYNLTQRFALQTEMIFMKTKAEVKNSDILVTNGAEFNLMEFPLLLLYRSQSKKTSFYGGAIIQLRANDGIVYMEQSGSEMEMDNVGSEFIERGGFALTGGMLFEIPLKKNFMKLDFRYARAMTKWTPDNSEDESFEQLYPDYFHVTIGYGIKFF